MNGPEGEGNLCSAVNVLCPDTGSVRVRKPVKLQNSTFYVESLKLFKKIYMLNIVNLSQCAFDDN